MLTPFPLCSRASCLIFKTTRVTKKKNHNPTKVIPPQSLCTCPTVWKASLGGWLLVIQNPAQMSAPQESHPGPQGHCACSNTATCSFLMKTITFWNTLTHVYIFATCLPR